MKKEQSIITERKLRRIIRDEIARQYLIREGFLDSIKKPFAALSEKAKKVVMGKVDEIVKKFKDAMSSFSKPEGLDEFLKKFAETEGGMDLKSLAAEAELSDVVESISEDKVEKELSVEAFMLNSSRNAVVESSHEDLVATFVLIESYYEKRQSRLANLYEQSLITEVVGIASLAAAWWTAIKAIIGILGGLSLACKLLAAVFKKALKREDWAKKMEHYQHVFHELEEKALKVVAYPAPVAYAAYVAASGVKKIAAMGAGKETTKLLTYEEFNSPEQKEEKKAAEKLIHAALLSAIVFEAISHVGHAIRELAENTSHALSSIGHSAAEIGKETPEIVKASRAATAAGVQIA